MNNMLIESPIMSLDQLKSISEIMLFSAQVVDDDNKVITSKVKIKGIRKSNFKMSSSEDHFYIKYIIRDGEVIETEPIFEDIFSRSLWFMMIEILPRADVKKMLDYILEKTYDYMEETKTRYTTGAWIEYRAFTFNYIGK